MGRLAGIIGQIRWYVSSLMGDNHYQRYLAHHRRLHPGESVITEAEYWRMRHRASNANPGARCC